MPRQPKTIARRDSANSQALAAEHYLVERATLAGRAAAGERFASALTPPEFFRDPVLADAWQAGFAEAFRK